MYDIDLYAIVIYQLQVMFYRFLLVTDEQLHLLRQPILKTAQLISCAYFVLIHSSIFRYQFVFRKVIKAQKMICFFFFNSLCPL